MFGFSFLCFSPEFRLEFYRKFTSADFAVANNDHTLTLAVAPLDNSYLPKTFDDHQELILLDVNCDGMANILNNSRHELNDFVWILFKSKQLLESLDTEIELIFANILISPKSEIFYLYKDVESNRILIKQIYRTATDTPLTIEWMGTISNDNEFMDMRFTKITSRRRQNLDGIILRAAMVVTSNDTLNHLHDYRFVLRLSWFDAFLVKFVFCSDIEIDPITKVNHMLTGYLMDYLNASVNYSVVNSWGYKSDETGDWR